MKKQGCAIVLVSHDAGQVERLCDRALWLKNGVVEAYGEPTVVAGQYTMQMRSQTDQRTQLHPPELTSANAKLIVNENRFGSLEVEIVDVRFHPAPFIDSGCSLAVEIDYQANQSIDSAIFSLSITDENGKACLDVNTNESNIPSVRLREKGTLKLLLERLDLKGGQYFINIGIFHCEWEYAYDYHWHVYPLVIDSSLHSKGFLCPPMRWEVVACDSTQD
jgi:lipopolysaccharide transport system ATP-binding protein